MRFFTEAIGALLMVAVLLALFYVACMWTATDGR